MARLTVLCAWALRATPVDAAPAPYADVTLPSSTQAGVVEGPGGVLYGVTYDGGDYGKGTLFRAPKDLSSVTVLHSFTGGIDGEVPYTELLLGTGIAAGKLFGTTHGGGTSGGGTIFSFDLGTEVVTPLVGFNAFGGSAPLGKLIQIGSSLFGTLFSGGVIFGISTTGADYSVLHVLSTDQGQGPGGLTLGPDGFLYGSAVYGGEFSCFPQIGYNGCGSVFRIKPDGSEFAVVYRFTVPIPSGFPQRSVVASADGFLYGTTYRGVFRLNPDPSSPNFTMLYTLPAGAGSQIFSPPIEGSDGRLYSVQYDGGANFSGRVFSLKKDGTGFDPRYDFPPFGTQGPYGPYGILYRDSAGTLFGTTEYTDTASAEGVIFALRGSNRAPIAAASAPATVNVGPTCTALVPFDGSASSDPDGDTLSYTWREGLTVIATGTTPTVPLGVGVHTITLTVDDGNGATNSIDVVVTVTGDAVLAYTGPALLQQGSNLLTAILTANGLPVAAALVTFDVDGVDYAATTDAAGAASVTANASGVSVHVVITYAGGACGQSATTTLDLVVNRPPLAVAIVPSTVVAGAQCTAIVSLDGTLSDDLDGDPLTYEWTEGVTTLASTATANVALPGGTHTITLTVDDGRGGTSMGSRSVDVLGEATALAYTGPTTVLAGVATQLSALLTVVGGPVSNAAVRFEVNGATYSDLTDAAGVAEVTAVLPGPSQNLRVRFLGDACRQASTADQGLTVVQTATLIVTKTVINDHGGTAGSADFTLAVAGTTPNPSSFPGSAAGTTVTLAPGGYSVTEGGPAGYAATYSADCSGTIAAGETKTCAITNDDNPATLTLAKVVIRDNGGNASAADWVLLANGLPFPQGVPQIAPAGVYILTETGGPTGYAATGWSCTGGTLVGNLLTLALGQSASCTITNDDEPARLTLTKVVVNDNGGSAVAADWTLTATGVPFASGVAAPIDAGTYGLAESGGPTGYTASAWVCTGGTLSGNQLTLVNGQVASCTITNDDTVAKLIVIKNVVKDDGGAADASDFTLTVTGTSPNPASFGGSSAGVEVALGPGVYAVSESGPAGYTASYTAGCAGTIAAGETRTCIVTNDDNPATLVVVKRVVNDNGGAAVAGDFTIVVTGSSPNPASFAGSATGTDVRMAPGAYAVSESGPAGYVATYSPECSGPIAVGEIRTCTITNDDEPARLTLTKVVVNDNGGSAVAADWTLTATGVPFASGVAAPIDAGTYALAETGSPAGYTAGAWTCAGGTLVGETLTLRNGQTATCNITNDDQPAPTSTVVTSAPNPSLYGSRVSLVATVTGSRGPSGTVQFRVDGVLVGTPVPVVDGQAAGSISTLSVGSHTIAAQYSGDQNNAPSAGTTPHATIPRPLTVAADNVTAILGASLPAFAVSVAGGVVAGDNLGLLSCTTTAPLTAAGLSAVGGYPITCSGYTNPNYTFAYLDGLLSVVYRMQVIAPATGGTFPTKSFVRIRFLLTDVAGNQIPDGEAGALVIPRHTCQVEIAATGAQTEGPDCPKYDARPRQFSHDWKLRPRGVGPAQIDITVAYPGTPVVTSESVAIQIVP